MPSGVVGKVRIVFLDVDGTMTDGAIGWDTQGDQRSFYVRDGLALDWARESGLLPVVISGRDSEAARGRMIDLHLEHYLGIKDKVAVADAVLQVRAVAKHTTVHEGGRGAVREAVEMLLRHNGDWDDVLKKYEAS